MAQTVQRFTELVNEKETSRILAVSIAALRRWRREGRGPQFTRVEGCVRYDLRSIERFIAENSSSDRKTADTRSGARSEACGDDASPRS